MDISAFERIKTGVCSYFLILYSCMQLLQNLWYSSAGDNLAESLMPFTVPALMLACGIYMAKCNKIKAAVISDDEKPLLSAAVNFIGGWIILAMSLKYIAPYFVFVMAPGQFEWKSYLFPLIYYSPFLIAGAVAVRKGSQIKERPAFSVRITLLCMRIVLLLICVLSVRQILLWTGPFIIFNPHEISPTEAKWIVTETVFIAASLILYFAPLRLKMNLKTADSEDYRKLARQSFTLTGFIILITGIPFIGNAVIRKYDSFDFFFFDIKEFLLQLLPTLFLVIAGLFLMYCGKDKEHMTS